MRDRGGAKAIVLLLLGIVVVLFALGGHWVTYSRITGGRTICVLTKERLGLDETIVTASSELKLALQHPILAARLASGSGVCVNF